jgi:hypothetical protein
MQGPLIELEHFRVLLKSLRGHGLSSSPILAYGIRAAQVSGSDFQLVCPDSFLSKASPLFSSSCHGPRRSPVLLIPCLFLVVSKARDRISCSVKSFYR